MALYLSGIIIVLLISHTSWVLLVRTKTPTSASFSRSECLLFYRVAFQMNLTGWPLSCSISSGWNSAYTSIYLVNLLQLFISQSAFAIIRRISVMIVGDLYFTDTFTDNMQQCVSPLPGLLQKKSTWKLLWTSLGCSCDRMSISVMGEAACLRSSMSHTYARGRSHFPYLENSPQPHPPLLRKQRRGQCCRVWVLLWSSGSCKSSGSLQQWVCVHL